MRRRRRGAGEGPYPWEARPEASSVGAGPSRARRERYGAEESSRQPQGMAAGAPGPSALGQHLASASRGSLRPEHVPATLVLHSTTAVTLQVMQTPYPPPPAILVCLAETGGKRRTCLLPKDTEQTHCHAQNTGCQQGRAP